MKALEEEQRAVHEHEGDGEVSPARWMSSIPGDGISAYRKIVNARRDSVTKSHRRSKRCLAMESAAAP